MIYSELLFYWNDSPVVFCASMQGSVVRAIRRLDQLLKEVEAAVQLMGDIQLTETLSVAIKALERDIIFAASLYL